MSSAEYYTQVATNADGSYSHQIALDFPGGFLTISNLVPDTYILNGGVQSPNQVRVRVVTETQVELDNIDAHPSYFELTATRIA